MNVQDKSALQYNATNMNIHSILFVLIIIIASVFAIMSEEGQREGSAQGRKEKCSADTCASDVVPVDGFPYRTFYMPPFEKMFTRLREAVLVPKQEKDRALGVIERTFPFDYEMTDSLSDHFAEPVRIECRESGMPSPREVWKKIRRIAIKIADIRQKREMVYEKSRGCNLFNAAFATYLCRRFGIAEGNSSGGAILDCTAGWGDRLVGAFAAGMKIYRGWDTNPALTKVYKSLADSCISAGAQPLDWSVQCAPFESASDLFKKEYAGMFDMAFVCPPFFDQELYNGPRTSTTVHVTYESWMAEFYIPLLRQARASLKKGGYIVAYIRPSDMFGVTRDELKDMKYLGAIGFKQVVEKAATHIRDAFVWQKSE